MSMSKSRLALGRANIPKSCYGGYHRVLPRDDSRRMECAFAVGRRCRASEGGGRLGVNMYIVNC